jgi:uncharacterized protein YyaL (SSP411 family)
MSKTPAAGPDPPNHLIREKSPYLQQHAHNPVDWYPWGDEAFRRATGENKPVFLSIGYATCHWCHVMARESFGDRAVAAILNTHFIAVKVDREERPDIDSIYMAACQHMTGQGGWPLTIIMTPDKKPFFAGTYLPRKSHNGVTGLEELLTKVARLWQEQQDSLVTAAEELTHLLSEPSGHPPRETAGLSLLRGGYEETAASFDPAHGGFGRAPKFPVPAKILFLLRYWKRTGSDAALRMAEQTLDALRCGGIHDHLGGGFHRYSTDTAWRIPHFEKMLYDQALLLMAFTEAWLATKKPAYRKTAEGIVRYVTRDLSSPEGAFISAEDADSPEGEGAYYLWTRKELDDILGPRDGPYAADLFHVRTEGNLVMAEPGYGKNVLYLRPGNGLSPDEESRTAIIRDRLLAAREERMRPPRDTKVLTDWNGLMIAALAQSSRAFENPEYYRAASTAMQVILERLQAPGGGLLHRYCDGEAAIPAFADDYAFVIRALIELYGTGFDPGYLVKALELDRYLREHFSDTEGAGFFSTSEEGESLLARRKEIYDGALPSSNSAILANLVLLGHLTGDHVHDERASRLADAFAGIVRMSPSAYSAYLCGLDHLLGPATDVVIAGTGSDPGAHEMIRILRTMYLPSVTVHFRTPPAPGLLDAVAPFTRTMAVQDGTATAYVCTGHTCQAPVTTVEALQALLGEKK